MYVHYQFLANAPILYPLKTPENLSNIGQKWVKCKLKDINEVLRYCRQISLVILSKFK